MLSTVEKVLFLKGVALFGDIPGRELTRVAEVARMRTFATGETLIREGDVGDFLYLIVEVDGKVLDLDGRTRIYPTSVVRLAGVMTLTFLQSSTVERGTAAATNMAPQQDT